MFYSNSSFNSNDHVGFQTILSGNIRHGPNMHGSDIVPYYQETHFMAAHPSHDMFGPTNLVLNSPQQPMTMQPPYGTTIANVPSTSMAFAPRQAPPPLMSNSVVQPNSLQSHPIPPLGAISHHNDTNNGWAVNGPLVDVQKSHKLYGARSYKKSNMRRNFQSPNYDGQHHNGTTSTNGMGEWTNSNAQPKAYAPPLPMLGVSVNQPLGMHQYQSSMGSVAPQIDKNNVLQTINYTNVVGNGNGELPIITEVNDEKDNVSQSDCGNGMNKRWIQQLKSLVDEMESTNNGMSPSRPMDEMCERFDQLHMQSLLSSLKSAPSESQNTVAQSQQVVTPYQTKSVRISDGAPIINYYSPVTSPDVQSDEQDNNNEQKGVDTNQNDNTIAPVNTQNMFMGNNTQYNHGLGSVAAINNTSPLITIASVNDNQNGSTTSSQGEAVYMGDFPKNNSMVNEISTIPVTIPSTMFDKMPQLHQSAAPCNNETRMASDNQRRNDVTELNNLLSQYIKKMHSVPNMDSYMDDIKRARPQSVWLTELPVTQVPDHLRNTYMAMQEASGTQCSPIPIWNMVVRPTHLGNLGEQTNDTSKFGMWNNDIFN